jgi:predicted dehydrogenase
MTIRHDLIGAGMMGQEHIRNFGLLDGCEVSAIADPSPEVRDTSVQTSGGTAQSFADYNQMISADLRDALVIASPKKAHTRLLVSLEG